MPTWLLILQCLPLAVVIAVILLLPMGGGHRWTPPVPPPPGWDARGRDMIASEVKHKRLTINQVLDMHGYRNLPSDTRREFMRELKHISRDVIQTNVT